MKLEFQRLPVEARIHRELVVLVVLTAVTVAVFFLTRSAAVANEEMHRADAAAWFELGREQQAAGANEEARAAFRRAVTNDPGNREYRLRLAEVLAAGGQDAEAERVLAAVRETNPEDPDAALQLARIDARRGNVDASRRAYQSALAGLWRPEQREARRRVRMELVDFLLAHEERTRALSELLVMAADLPDDPGLRVEMGNRFLAAGDTRRALEHFTAVLQSERDHPAALAGAGLAAFQRGDYAAARRYLNAAPDDDPRVAEPRQITEFVLGGDPLAVRLAAAERRRRAAAALEEASGTLDACVMSAPGDEPLRAIQAEMQAFLETFDARSRRDPRDVSEEAVALAARAETAVERVCAPLMTPVDRAILLIGRRYGLDAP